MKKFWTLLFILLILATSFYSECFAKSHIKKIDMEHHYYIPEIYDYMATRKEPPTYDKKTTIQLQRKGITPITNNIKSVANPESGMTMLDDITSFGEERIKNMDKVGVDMVVLCVSPFIEEFPKEEAVRLARLSNDRVYELTKKYPDRFIGAAVLPAPYIDESIKELKRCKKMGFKYWHTHSNYGEEHLYDPKYEPLLKTAAELNMAIYVHPQYPTDKKYQNMGIAYAGPGFGFGQDVMHTTLRLILNGTFDKYPNLKMIIGHFGEYYPFVMSRMDNRFSMVPTTKNQHPISYYFKNKNIFVTTSGNDSQEALRCTINVLGIDSIMFGSDYPYENYQNMVNVIDKSKILSKKDKEKIFYKNAEKYILNNK